LEGQRESQRLSKQSWKLSFFGCSAEQLLSATVIDVVFDVSFLQENKITRLMAIKIVFIRILFPVDNPFNSTVASA
jgi:hypothetical protein